METLDVSVQDLGRCLRLTDCPEVMEALRGALREWPLASRPANGLAPAICLHREGDGFVQFSPELPRGLYLPTPVAAACSLVADLVGSYFTRYPELTGLHCGSVEIGGRLVIFPESHRAGKSTLSAAFAAAGQRVFGDDVLALTPRGTGMALGIAPRLRLPLPASLDPALKAFAELFSTHEDDRYRYLSLSDGTLAAHGECLGLGAVVLLERDDAIDEPELVTLAPGEGLLQLLCQNFAHEERSETLMARFLPLMASVPCLLLRYGEPLAAARRLVMQLSDAGQSSLAVRSSATVSLTTHRHQAGVDIARIATGHWRAGREVRDYPLGDELFLIHTPSGAIHRLNTSGRMVWTLLSHAALTVDELASLLIEHYGDEATATVEADVAELIGRLATADLIKADLIQPG